MCLSINIDGNYFFYKCTFDWLNVFATFHFQEKCSFKWWWPGIPLSLKHTEKESGSQTQMGGQRFRQRNERREEWMMRGGRADVWGPPCLPSMSSSPPFPHLSVSLSFWLYSDFMFFLFLLLFLTPPSLPFCVSFSFPSVIHLSLSSLCFYSCLFAV